VRDEEQQTKAVISAIQERVDDEMRQMSQQGSRYQPVAYQGYGHGYCYGYGDVLTGLTVIPATPL
jgi:hypothetical protein